MAFKTENGEKGAFAVLSASRHMFFSCLFVNALQLSRYKCYMFGQQGKQKGLNQVGINLTKVDTVRLEAMFASEIVWQNHY